MGLPVKPAMTVMPGSDRASRPLALRALSRAAVRVATSFSLSQGFTIKSKAPLFIPSTASWISAYAVNSTTSTSGAIFLSSPVQYSPSLPVLISVWKFISSSTTSGRNRSSTETKVDGEGIASTSSKCIGNRIFNACLIPALSSTISIFPFLEAIKRVKFSLLPREKQIILVHFLLYLQR